MVSIGALIVVLAVAEREVSYFVAENKSHLLMGILRQVNSFKLVFCWARMAFRCLLNTCNFHLSCTEASAVESEM